MVLIRKAQGGPRPRARPWPSPRPRPSPSPSPSPGLAPEVYVLVNVGFPQKGRMYLLTSVQLKTHFEGVSSPWDYIPIAQFDGISVDLFELTA